MVAVAACLLGYGEVGLWLVDEAENNNEQSGFVLEGNPYKRWIDVRPPLLLRFKHSYLDISTGILRREIPRSRSNRHK